MMSDETNSADVTIQKSTIASTKKALQNINEACAKKFTEGGPIIDKKNPFKNNNFSKKYQTNKEIYKNALNSLQRSPSDDLITTEDVLRQSKYVKTYIKNPDPYFVYDPEVLARIEADELERTRVPTNRNGALGGMQEIKSVNGAKNVPELSLPYKKCSKPNYPNLADIKVKVGTELDGTFLNPTEVKTNAKKFDECVKKINFNFDEYSEDMDEHLKNSSVEEISTTIERETHSNNRTKYNKEFLLKSINSSDSQNGENCVENGGNENNESLFSNTIRSNDFKEYLKNRGLMLAPQRTLNSCKASHSNGINSKPNNTVVLKKFEHQKSFKQEASDRDSSLMDTPKKVKKSSIFQRLLANNIFSVRRKTIPKETVPNRRSIYESGSILHVSGKDGRQRSTNKRIVLEGRKEQNKSGEFSYISKPFRDGENMKAGKHPDGVQRNRPTGYDQSPAHSDNHLVKTENSYQPKHYAPPIKLNKNRTQTMPLPLQHTRVHSEPTNSSQTFGRTSSMDRNEILKRSRAAGLQRPFQAQELSRSPTGSVFRSGSITTSTPTRPPSSTDSGLIQCASLSTLTSSLHDDEIQPTGANASKNEFLALRAKQKLPYTKDCDLYTKVLNRNLRNNENLYERLQRTQAEPSALQPMYSALYQSRPFVRGDPQRNTFCGVIQSHRLSGRNSLSREEIMDKVRQFCRNSMRRKTDHQTQPPNSTTNHYVVQNGPEVSPASYASVATERFFPTSHVDRNPPDPPRMQSLPRKPLAHLQSVSAESSEAYANIWKDKKISPNQTEPQRSVQNTNTGIIANKSQEVLSTGRTVVNRTQLKSCLNTSQVIPKDSSETVDVSKKNFAHTRTATESPAAMCTLFQPRPFDGRSTPLILEGSHNLQSQIYRPRHGGSMTQYNVRNHLLRHSNLRFGQCFSDSINFQPDYCNQTTDVPKSVQQQQPLQIYAHEQYLPEVKENEGLKRLNFTKEDWQNENKSGRQQTNDQVNDERRRSSRREDPRRHTLGGDMLQYGVMQGQPQQRAMDLENQSVRSYAPVNQGPLFDEDPGIMSEVETASTGFRRGGKQRSSLPVVRTPSKTLERPLGLVFLQYRSETKRALLPNEITSIDTVRALFVRSFPRQLTMAYLEGPNVKIYIHDASKDMFYELEDVRSHLREIRDRSVLRLFESNEVSAPPQVLPGGPGIPQPLPQAVPMQWDQDQSYFSEPEFDSEYQHQHIHKSKSGKQPPYYVGASQTLPRGMYSDRNKVPMGAPAKPLRSYGSRGNLGPIFPYPPDQLYSIPDGYTSSPERGTRGSYEEPYYSQYGTRGNVAPVIDEETSEVAIPDDQYALYGMKLGPGRIPRTANQMYDPTRPEDLHRIRVEHMERQLANLTGLVQKALVNQNPQIAPAAVPIMNANYLGVPTQCRDKSVSFEKSVSFSDDIQGVPKSHSPQHAADSKPTKPAIKSSTLPRTSSQERDRLKPPPPPKPIALTQTHASYRADIALAPEVYNHLRGLQKKAKDLRIQCSTLRRLSQAQAVAVREDIKDAFIRIRATLLASSGNYWDQQGDQEKTRVSREEELYKQEIIRLEKDLGDLESSVEGLRGEVINRRTRVNMAAVEDMALVLSRASKTVAELKLRFPGLSNGMRNLISSEMERVVREEKFLKEEPDRLESALRRCKKLTGTLVTLKRLASVQEQRLPPNEPPTNEEPPSSTEIPTPNKQPVPTPRMGPINISGGVPPENALDALLDELQTFAKPLNQHNDLRPDDSTSDDSSQMILSTVTTQIPQACLYTPNDPNAAPHELQEQSKAAGAPLNPNSKMNANILQVNANLGSLRRLHSYPSGSDTDTSPPQPTRLPGKPPVPERNAELLSKVNSKRIPPPPPPRTSSRSPLASPTSPNVPHRMPPLSETEPLLGNGATAGAGQDGSGNSSGNESGNDQVQRQVALERRHQELLRKQKLLQEQYLRLQQISKMPSVSAMPPPPSEILQLKKTGSESNLPKKMDLSIANSTGSMKNLNTEAISCSTGSVSEKNEKNIQLAKQQLKNIPKAGVGVMSTPQTQKNEADGSSATCPETTLNNNSNSSITTTIKQVYETEIL